MSEPQTWTIIVLLGGAFFTTLTLISTLFTRVIKAEIGGLRGEMNARFDAVDNRFDAVNARIDNLDRDVQFLMGREAER